MCICDGCKNCEDRIVKNDASVQEEEQEDIEMENYSTIKNNEKSDKKNMVSPNSSIRNSHMKGSSLKKGKNTEEKKEGRLDEGKRLKE